MTDSTLIQVVDNKSPIVVLFGPQASGKTMALIRLTRFLMCKGNSVIPDLCFRPPQDSYYSAICESFLKMSHSDYAVPETDLLLVKVHDNTGNVICQILDVSGMYCFDKYRPEALSCWPEWFYYIRRLPNKRIWSIFVEEGWEDHQTRSLYSERINLLANMMSLQDKSIFVFSKVDKMNWFSNSGEVRKPVLCREIQNQYPSIFTPFKNNPPKEWFKKYRCQFVPFSSGRFLQTNTGKELYNMGADIYPMMLWKAILRSIK